MLNEVSRMNIMKVQALSESARNAARILREYYAALHEAEKICAVCKQAFVGIDTQKYCSARCRRRAQYWRRKRKRGEFVPVEFYNI